MGLFDKLRGEIVDIIEWLDSSKTTLAYRFERYNNEIKYGAKLIVREGQVAVFVNEGRVADVFHPGTYTLETRNMPLLSTLMGWKHGFNSPFKAEVYFFSTQRFTDLKWGTKNPVILRDPEFGPVRVRAFGTYGLRVEAPEDFLKELVSTNARFHLEDIVDQGRNIIISRFSDLLGESKVPILDLAGQYDELSDFLLERIAPDFMHYGLGLVGLLVENVSLPPEVEKALDARSSMGILGNMQQYTQFQAAKAMETAAATPGSAAGMGMGMGMGMAMAQQISQSAQSTQAGVPQAPVPQVSQSEEPPPLPGGGGTAWYAGLEGRKAGPFSQEQLASMIQAGTLNAQNLVWCKGMAAWLELGQVEALKALLAELPPPLPPSF